MIESLANNNYVSKVKPVVECRNIIIVSTTDGLDFYIERRNNGK